MLPFLRLILPSWEEHMPRLYEIKGSPRSFVLFSISWNTFSDVVTHLKTLHPISFFKSTFNCHWSSIPRCEWAWGKALGTGHLREQGEETLGWKSAYWGFEARKTTCLFNNFASGLVVGIIMIIIISKWYPIKCLIGHNAVLRELHRPIHFCIEPKTNTVVETGLFIGNTKSMLNVWSTSHRLKISLFSRNKGLRD